MADERTDEGTKGWVKGSTDEGTDGRTESDG